MKISIISSLILLALGILLIFQSEATIITISYIIGALLIAIGVMAGINYIKNFKESNKNELDVVYTLVCVILGIIVIKNPEVIASIIPVVIGVIIVVNSTTKLQYSLELKKTNNELWISTLALSIVMLVCGIVLIFNPFEGAVLLTRIVGIFILVYSILDLISTFIIKNSFDIVKKAMKEDIKEADIVEDNTKKKRIEKKKKEKKEDKTEEEPKDESKEEVETEPETEVKEEDSTEDDNKEEE